ncbi:MAG: sigma-70 family RNA polymerase sigma factor [Chloroflexi bacterium]|nr:sigma-70 family RNA polymerase sigma factor [Chloroflexota bacterium]
MNEEPMGPTDEQEAVRRAQAGEPDAFRYLVERYGDTLHGTAYLMTQNAAAADDAVQDAFIDAWRGVRGFRLGAPVKPWLVRILVNRVLALQRRRSLPTVVIEDVSEPGAEDPAEAQVDAADAVGRGLAALSAEHRRVVVLRYYGELTVPEIAGVLGWREGTVKSRLHRALAQLREVVGERS